MKKIFNEYQLFKFKRHTKFQGYQSTFSRQKIEFPSLFKQIQKQPDRDNYQSGDIFENHNFQIRVQQREQKEKNYSNQSEAYDKVKSNDLSIKGFSLLTKQEVSVIKQNESFC